MKSKLFLIIIFLVVQLRISAQNFIKEYGKIGKDEIELTEYTLDKTAEAVVLFDFGESYFVESEGRFNVIFERTTRIKILSDAGIKWADVEIPYYQEGGIYENVYDLEAFTYNFENGSLKKTQLQLSNCQNEKINEYWYMKKFAMPDVKEGSIIEYKYKINSQYKFNLRDWEFQWKIPVVYSEYIVKMIPFYEYAFILQGGRKLDVNSSYKDTGMPRQFGPSGGYKNNSFYDLVYKFGMKDIPAFKDEEFISSINDYICKIDFQLSKIHQFNGTSSTIMTTWTELIKELRKHKDFGKYIKKSKALGIKLLNESKLNALPNNERFEEILKYAKANFNWNKFNAKYASKSPNNFVKDKIGNSADINLFVTGLLNAYGIEAYPVLISTRNNGKIKYDYPFSHFFNYVIILAKVDGKNILTDATEVLSLNDRIPSRCINDKGLLVKEGDIEWVSLQCNVPSEIRKYFSIDMNDLELKTRVKVLPTEYKALYYRYYYGDDIKNISEKLGKSGYTIIDSTINVKNQLDTNKPYQLEYTIKNKAEELNNKIYIRPFLDEPITDNPLKQKNRTLPIDMVYPEKTTFYSTITIPDGYKVDYTPENYKISNSLFDLEYTVTKDDKKVNIFFIYFFKNSVYSAKDYSKIKYYFIEIIKMGNEKIVLKKD